MPRRGSFIWFFSDMNTRLESARLQTGKTRAKRPKRFELITAISELTQVKAGGFIPSTNEPHPLVNAATPKAKPAGEM
ncbi:hypothetical protein SAMN05421850_102409 [Lutimaribacter saemankumensis]|uniref:Uncharacterized protein n=2 Tax=Lutimaribacter saemankumensis TaxID=490829 RepID=A0A1G8K5B7_9RHOB|nr:hypothetical protein SAMN05421850_102409 [Lutimaribacter saemankumensis]